MSDPMQDDETSYNSIDDYLGPAEARFFGSGYRRVGYDLRRCELDPAHRRVEGRVEIDYPVDWSTKAARSLPPHLSTVDAIVLAARFGALAVRSFVGLPDADLSAMWLRRIDIKAAAAPDEHRLQDLPVAIDLLRTQPTTADMAVSTVSGQVGAMKVRCELVHPAAAPREGGSRADVEWRAGPYGDALYRRRQTVRELRLYRAARRTDAQVSMLGTDSAATAVDAFVVSLQLGQVLLYDLDGVDRTRSNTLWMRSATITAERAPTAPAQSATAALDGAKVLDARGARWRTATIVASCLGMQTRCAVAHELPMTASLRVA